MAKRNADQFERFSPASGERSSDRTSVRENTADAAPMDAVDGTRSGNIMAARSAAQFGAMLKLSLINYAVTEL
jgi:hypothetical protein